MKWGFIIAVGLGIWLIPIPEGVSPIAWKTLAIFVSTITGLILVPIPLAAFCVLSLSISILFKIGTTGEMLQGFSSAAVWIAVAAFLLAKGFSKTGLSRRIALMLMRYFGNSTLKLAYILTFSDFIFSPATPSQTARGGGIIYPIIKGLCEVFDSKPGGTERRVGAYLIQVGYQAVMTTSAMFMTAAICNPLVPVFAQKVANIDINWTNWAAGAIVPGLIALLVFPYLLYKIYPPEIKDTPEAPLMAAKELIEKGPMSRDEKIMLAVFLSCLALWATSAITGIGATVVALLGTSVLLVTGVITWKECLDENGAWDTLVWVGVLVSLAGLLTKHGLISWITKTVAVSLTGISWPVTLFVVLMVHLYAHYMFASLTGHMTALYPALLAVAVAGGAPPLLAALTLAYFSNICGVLTHYAAGATPIFFGAGYFTQATWWRLGFIASVVHIIIWLGIGPFWWKFLGYW